MPTPLTRLPGVSRALLASSVAALLLTACQQGKEPAAAASAPQGLTEIAWARVALERNPNIEVLATDTDVGVFTIREKASGAVYTVQLNQIAAAPLAQLKAPIPPPAPSEPATQTPAQSADADESTGEAGEEAAADASAVDTSGYKIERSEGQVRVTGPGVSIVSTQGTPESAARAAGAEPTDPIICEGRRMMHLDNRNIVVNGDAIVARGGCELHITNSRITASGTGLVVNGATVHLSNTTVDGKAASYNADGSARIFARGSTFSGQQKRHPYAVVQDLGGNDWRRAPATGQ